MVEWAFGGVLERVKFFVGFLEFLGIFVAEIFCGFWVFVVAGFCGLCEFYRLCEFCGLRSKKPLQESRLKLKICNVLLIISFL